MIWYIYPLGEFTDFNFRCAAAKSFHKKELMGWDTSMPEPGITVEGHIWKMHFFFKHGDGAIIMLGPIATWEHREHSREVGADLQAPQACQVGANRLCMLVPYHGASKGKLDSVGACGAGIGPRMGEGG